MAININHGLNASVLGQLALAAGRKTNQRQQAGNVLQFMANRQNNAARVRAAFFGGGGRSRGGSRGGQAPELSATDKVFKHKAQQEQLDQMRLANEEMELTNEGKAIHNDLYLTDLEKQSGMQALQSQGRAFQEKMTPEKMQTKMQDDFLSSTIQDPNYPDVRWSRNSKGEWKEHKLPKQDQNSFGQEKMLENYEGILEDIKDERFQQALADNPELDPLSYTYEPTEEDYIEAEERLGKKIEAMARLKKQVTGIGSSEPKRVVQPVVNPHSTGVAKSVSPKTLGFTGNTLSDSLQQKSSSGQAPSIDNTSLNSPDRQPGVIPEFPTGEPELMAIKSGVTPELYTQVKRMEELGLEDHVIVKHIQDNIVPEQAKSTVSKKEEPKGMARFIGSTGMSEQRKDIVSEKTKDKQLERIHQNKLKKEREKKEKQEKISRRRVFEANKRTLKSLGVDNFQGTPEEAIKLIIELRKAQ